MNEQQLSDIIRIETIRASHTTDLKFYGFDLAGTFVFGEILPEIPEEVRPTAFAVAASLFATGEPVYYSFSLNAISTDATFGTTPSKLPNFNVFGPLPVVRTEGIWRFAGNTGTLVLTLKDGPVAQHEVNDSHTFIGWLLMKGINGVAFDGETLATTPPREWREDAAVGAETRPERREHEPALA